jgi:hypothetical protein
MRRATLFEGAEPSPVHSLVGLIIPGTNQNRIPLNHMTSCIGTTRKLAFVAIAFLIFFIPLFSSSTPAAMNQLSERPIDVIKAYLKATHAHDFRTAYRYISTIDKDVRAEKEYIGSEPNFSGFALELAKKLADDMDIWVIKEEKNPTGVRFEVGYRVPGGDEMASQLFNWDPDKLNALSSEKQRRLLEAADSVKRRGKMITIEGREILDLIQQKSGWRIFLDWRSRARIVFKAVETRSGGLAVRFLRNDYLVKIGDPFQIDFTVKNRTDGDLIVKLNHLFEPPWIAESIDMIACGSLAPLYLRTHAVQTISSHYLLSGTVPKQTPLSIIYHFSAQIGKGGSRSSNRITLSGQNERIAGLLP